VDLALAKDGKVTKKSKAIFFNIPALRIDQLLELLAESDLGKPDFLIVLLRL